MIQPITELMRAWSVQLNDHDFSSILSMDYYLDTSTNSVTPGTNYRSNAIFGVELEYFALKDRVIDGGKCSTTMWNYKLFILKLLWYLSF